MRGREGCGSGGKGRGKQQRSFELTRTLSPQQKKNTVAGIPSQKRRGPIRDCGRGRRADPGPGRGRTLVVGEVGGDPALGGGVEVVRGLVQDQDLGLAE